MPALMLSLRNGVISDMTNMTLKYYYVFPVLENRLPQAETIKQLPVNSNVYNRVHLELRSTSVVVFDLITPA